MLPRPLLLTNDPSAPSRTRGIPAPIEPLFVDLDGTLLYTDLLAEGVLRLVRRAPKTLFSIPFWLAQGLPHLKRQVALRDNLDLATLPWNIDLLDYLRTERAQGRPIVLATASDRLWAERVSQFLKLFDDVLATDSTCNLKGTAKLQAIRAWCEQHGHSRFSYVGDSAADLPIWRQAANVLVVRPNRRIRLRFDAGSERPMRVFGRTRSRLRSLCKALRPHQWVKNLLIFAPMLLAHQWQVWDSLWATVIAFIAFSMCASSVYLVNDLLDVDSDRLHPEKRHRPIAAGDISVSQTLWLTTGLIIGSGAITATLLPATCLATQAVYFASSTLYSILLKRKPLVDVIALASLYLLRLFMGGLAADAKVSEWLLTFSGFLFISLAFAKRYAELTRLAREGGRRPKGRGYVVEDLSLVENFGMTSGYLSVAVLALYIHAPETKELYPHNGALWLICPLALYWVSRVWLFAKRRLLSEDPVVFAIRDRVSLVVGGVIAALAVLASQPW